MPRHRFLLPQLRRPEGAPKRGRVRGLVRSDESGFSLIEIVAASGIILVCLTLLMSVMTKALTQSGTARQRQSANNLANQTLEQIRALPFKNVQAGLSNSDTAGDPNITSTGCPMAPCFGGEQVVISAGLANLDPLVPHRKSVTVGPTLYQVAAYLTYYENSTSRNAYRATVYVTWTSLPAGQPAKVQAQTVIFSPSTCLATTTHPFSAPCNPSFSSHAIADAPSVTISGSVAGVTLDHLQLWGARASSDMLVEQISRVEGLAQVAGAALQAVSGPEVTVGRQSVISKADNDPATGGQQGYSTASASPVASSQSVGALTISTSAGSTASTTSTTASKSSTAVCPNLSGYTIENDEQPCGGASASQGATVSASAALDVLGLTTLASISPQVTPVVGITDSNKGPGSGTPGSGTCTSTPATGDGCTRAMLTRTAADIGVAGLGALGPLGFTNYARVTGLADQVKVEAGPGTNAPNATVSAGTVQYWNGLSYTSVSIPTLATAITIPTLSINTNPLVPSLGTEITLAGSIQPPTKSTSTTSVTTATNAACLNPPGVCQTSATAKSTGPSIDVTMVVKVLGVTIADLAISVYTGTAQSTATYTPTPLS